MKYLICFVLFTSAAWANRPAAYTELTDYVIQAPDQAETGTCLFMGSTGSLEILLNQRDGLTDQRPGDINDLSETFLIHQKAWNSRLPTIESAFMKFNWGETMHASVLPFDAETVWTKPPGFGVLERIEVPKVKTIRLFNSGGQWDTNVLKISDLEKVKQAMWKHRSPILINYNENRFWHVINIVGYDDELEGPCHEITEAECAVTKGSFYVRDHFGEGVEVRDADWFRVKGNAAIVVMLAE
jgi:hypothetical protein